MLNSNVFYHGIIRSTIVAFGSLFSNIYIDRKVGASGIDSVNGTTIQRLQVPIAYGPKEKWVVRIDQDPTLEQHTYITLPRMSFEISGYSYDVTRKLNKMNKVICNDGAPASSGLSAVAYAPVPYNISMNLYVVTKTQEDALQIIEQILPSFTPEYTLAVNAPISMIQNVPVILNSITATDDYDRNFQTRRFVIHTLQFTLKTNLYGNIQTSKPIFSTITNVASVDGASGIAHHYSAGATGTYEIIRDEWIEDL